MQRALLLLLVVLASCGSRPSASERTTASPVPGPSAATGSTSNPILDAHNVRRAAHCAPPLAWSEGLAQQAQRWADHLAASGCNLDHSQSAYGENLAAGTSGTLAPSDVVDMWYAESGAYDYARGDFSMETGHFTQLVWTTSTSLGCAMTTCNGLDLWVCNYDPPGNYEGDFQAHVLPTSCTQ